MTISISLHGSPISSASRFFGGTSVLQVSKPRESELLQSIRTALRGSGTDLATIHSTIIASDEALYGEQELTWNYHTVILSTGGVMQKKWNFEGELQSIQWACLGWLEQSTSTASVSSHSAAHYASASQTCPIPAPVTSSRSTFGPFTKTQQGGVREEEDEQPRVRAVYVFFRSIGKIFLRNGLEFTFALPFIVRKAWPLHPHGVMLQRVLEPNEIEEAEATGDLPLPTIFSMTSPYSEAAAVGLTTGILHGFDKTPASLEDEDENSTKPLRSVPAAEMVIWASSGRLEASNDVLVTVDPETHNFSIWRYAYIKPKDIPVPLGRNKTRNMIRKRQSISSKSTNRRHSTFANTLDRPERFAPTSPDITSSEETPVFEAPELPPLSALPGMPPALTTTTTMESLLTGGSSSQPPWSTLSKARRNSLSRNDLSVTMDRMVLGGRIDADVTLAPIEHGRMRAAYWMEKLYSQEISDIDSQSWSDISVSLFDHRWDGETERSLMAICFPAMQTLSVFSLTMQEDKLKAAPLAQISAISAVSMRATRDSIWDLFIIKPDHSLSILTHGLRELPLEIQQEASTSAFDDTVMEVDADLGGGVFPVPIIFHKAVVSLRDPVLSSCTLLFEDGSTSRTTIDLVPQDLLTCQSLQVLALTLPADFSFAVHTTFLEFWSSHGLSTSGDVEFKCFTAALYRVFDLDDKIGEDFTREYTWSGLSWSPSYFRFCDDLALKGLHLPAQSTPPSPSSSQPMRPPHDLLAPVLYALHTLGENMRLTVNRYDALLRLAPVICRIAVVIRPEWADYWKRLCPDAMTNWPSLKVTGLGHLDDRIPVWPPDISAILYGRISNPDWNVPWYGTEHLARLFEIKPSCEYGREEPLSHLLQLTAIYMCLADGKVKDTRKRAENAIMLLVESQPSVDFVTHLPLGIASPLKEAARTCQLSPPGDWPITAYTAVGRNDRAASANRTPDILFNDGYRSMKSYIDSSGSRKTINHLIKVAGASAFGEIDAVSGVELDLEDFTGIRFGQDRRLEEVARMLCSSSIPSVKVAERPELNEHDQAKEQQHQVVRIAERTLALPYGRAMFTFGTLGTITKEAYAIPKLEYTIRMQPQNTTAAPEPGKIPQECLSWGEFHNGVAAGLRIAPTSSGVESSWIAYNKPSELTPAHAGFLFGLGLTGHLREMLTWHTFSYLTPKHDLTSIAVLLGLAAANVGSGNRHVTKLLAVHTPALLPTPAVDLNVSLMTQAAGLAGVGLLYMGTKQRRMAEVCLNQISRKDLVQPDLSNEHREAYTYAAALAFGMIMLGKGSSIPADMALASRLRILVHGNASSTIGVPSRPLFDINLTSPAATIALGLMYLRTERREIAGLLAIPDTILELNRIQPSFLLIRTVARSLIMWDAVAPTQQWISAQIPLAVARGMEGFPGKRADDAVELAYFNILAGGCFVIGLKYAGTARQEAYHTIITYFDLFNRLVFTNGPTFDHKIKRSAVREGLNLISISLSMVMAGTGELSCFRRLRYTYGLVHHAFRYGIHVATHLSLGLLFLGGGRFTLGTSDAAIACMVAAFFPRFHHVSSDNKSYLQALRHLWVLAVEPRCLVARDVDTSEVVYLPVKIATREGSDTTTIQMVCPTLIPDLDKLLSIRVDTPRYWPFYLDIERHPRHKEALLRSQTLYVKRRTAFLSYTEDPRGSRSFFVRSGSSAGDAATLDFPQLTDTKTHPAGDLSEFISSFSNDILYLSFADHFSREDGETPDERLFHTYCHATLLDSILQDKPQTLQTHLTLYRYRTMSPTSRYFNLRLQDLRFAADFYSKIYDRRFSGLAENNARAPLIRENTVSGAIHALDQQLDHVRTDPQFLAVLGQYARGEEISCHMPLAISRQLAWYLLRNGVPVSTPLVILKSLARDAHVQCMDARPPDGTSDSAALHVCIKAVLHGAGTKMTTALGSGWSVRSLDEIINAWNLENP